VNASFGWLCPSWDCFARRPCLAVDRLDVLCYTVAMKKKEQKPSPVTNKPFQYGPGIINQNFVYPMVKPEDAKMVAEVISQLLLAEIQKELSGDASY